MAEAVNQNSADNGQVGTTEVNKTDTQKNFTQEEVDRIVRKRLSEENSKAEERQKNAIQEAIAEYDRKAKLTEEDRLNEERKAKDDELAQKEREITIRENRADAIEQLAKLNIDTSLVDFVVDIDKDKTMENIKNLEKAFNAAVAKSVEAKLAGKTPKDFGDGSKTTDKDTKLTAKGYQSNGITAF